MDETTKLDEVQATETDETQEQGTKQDAGVPAPDKPAEGGAAAPAEAEVTEPEEKEHKHTISKDALPAAAAENVVTSSETADAVNGLKSRLLNMTAHAMAVSIGVQPDRVEQAIKLAGLEEIDVTAADADAKIKAAIEKVIGEVPEFAAPANTGSAGTHRRTTPDDGMREAIAGAMGVKL